MTEVAVMAESVPPPLVMLHVTPALFGSLATVTVKVSLPPATNGVDDGEVMVTTIAGGGAPPPHPTIRANAAKPANTREKRRTFDMDFPIFLK